MAPHASGDFDLQPVTDTQAVAIPDPIVTKGLTRSVFTVDHVLPHRQSSAPMSGAVAAFAAADMFKSKSCFKKPKSKRWDHRISYESSCRKPSSLKGALKHFRPGMISLCGGLPSSDYFPFDNVSVKLPVAPNFSEPDTAVSGEVFTAGKHDITEGSSLYDLSVALNYGQSMGPPQLIRFVTEHTEIVHDPPYSDWDICMTAGSTSALEISLRMFTTRGDYIMTEEYSFSTAIETVQPLGVKLLGIKMDKYGMLPDDLEHVLSTWNEAERGAPRPFLVYTVPTGQNPTSSTQPLERRKAIYAIAEKHDLFILEDEPYFFLQMESFVSGHTHVVPSPFTPQPIQSFLSSLIPSFLHLDTSGRVLRLDSFSKIVAPGTRTGWVTGSTQIIERFIRHSEVTAQNPSGFSEMILFKLLDENWGHKGFLEWLMFIRAEYTRRRDIIVNACEKYLPTQIAKWSPPMAGMFHWIEVDFKQHPDYTSLVNSKGAEGEEEENNASPPQTNGHDDSSSNNGHLAIKNARAFSFDDFLALEEKIFLAGVEQNILMGRGSWFRADRGTDEKMFFRTTFAAASAENIVEAVRRMGVALRKEFQIEE